jgi:hypothetical protein
MSQRDCVSDNLGDAAKSSVMIGHLVTPYTQEILESFEAFAEWLAFDSVLRVPGEVPRDGHGLKWSF